MRKENLHVMCIFKQFFPCQLLFKFALHTYYFNLVKV